MKKWNTKWILTNSNSCPTRQRERDRPMMAFLHNCSRRYRWVRTNGLCCPLRCPPSSDIRIDCWLCFRVSILAYSRINVHEDNCWRQHGWDDSTACIGDNLMVAMVAIDVVVAFVAFVPFAAVVHVECCAEHLASNSAYTRSFERDPILLRKQSCQAKISSASIRFGYVHRSQIMCRHCDRPVSLKSAHSIAATNGYRDVIFDHFFPSFLSCDDFGTRLWFGSRAM